MGNYHKSNPNYAKIGSYNVLCDTCGFKYKREDCRFKQTSTSDANLLVCFNCWEKLHPWLIPLPLIKEMLPIPNARPRPNFKYTGLPLAFDGYIGSQYLINSEWVTNFTIGTVDFIIGGVDQQSNPWPNWPVLP